ncbi:hypothetical protein DVH05_003360 [Phytophthora capsici]|nr:hypothetical protein DVH05_003360 [Phytophthora capsici]
MKGSKEEPTLGYDDMAESTERLAAIEGATERSKDTPDVEEGATERSQAALGYESKVLEKKEAGEPSYDTEKYRDALRTRAEDAESVVTGQQSSMVGAVQANTAESGVREADGGGTHGTVPARGYQRLLTDKELDISTGEALLRPRRSWRSTTRNSKIDCSC